MNRTVVEEVQVEVFKPKTHFEELDDRQASAAVKGTRGLAADVEDYEYYSEDDERQQQQ